MLNSFSKCIRLARRLLLDGTNISSNFDDHDDDDSNDNESEGEISNLHMLNRIATFQQEINACI